MKERLRPMLNLLCRTSICHEQRLLGWTCRGEVHRTSVNLKIPHIVKNHVGNDWLSFFFSFTKNEEYDSGRWDECCSNHPTLSCEYTFSLCQHQPGCALRPTIFTSRSSPPSRTRALIPRHTQLQRQRNRQEKKRMERIRPTYTIFVREQS